MKNKLLSGFFFLVLAASFSWGQTTVYPDTLWVPVIFYDYHADGRSDFERCTDPGNAGMKGMVQGTLDVQRKPVPTALACPANPGTFPCACHLAEWFRVSGAAGSDNTCQFICDSTRNPDKRYWSWSNLVPFPGANGRAGEYVGPNFTENNPTCNVIIYDSLPFLLSPTGAGIYEYRNDQFFKLDGRGFGEEPAGSGHNFAYTMELHTVFKYKKGLTFTFRGDDDVWAFVNGQLMMDLGGLHQALNGSFNLDNFAGLIEGHSYSFDLYYAERHTDAAHIWITSNIISSGISGLELRYAPGLNVKPGDSINFWTVLTGKDSLGFDFTDSTNLVQNVKWEIRKPAQSQSLLRNGTGPASSNVFVAGSPNETDTVIVTYTNTTTGKTYQARQIVKVGAGTIYHLISAVTRDNNQNGYIDQVEVSFDKDTTFTLGTANFNVTGPGGVPLKVTKVDKAAGGKYLLTIEENRTILPQSSWTPTVTVGYIPGVQNGSVTAADGCPPVIWRATVYQASEDRRQDTVTIYMSEKIYGKNGTSFPFGSTQPSQMLNIWNLGGTVKDAAMLNGIPGFLKMTGDSILVFLMSNGDTLTDSNRVNINAAPLLVYDKKGNTPNDLNQKVRIEIVKPITHASPVPNPSGPTSFREKPGVINIVNNPQSMNWVKEDHAGTVIRIINLPLPVDKDPQTLQKISAVLKIYDPVGNVVISKASSGNFVGDVDNTATTKDIFLYWNGFNGNQMKVAPGVYRAVVYIDYHGAKDYRNTTLKNTSYVAKLGVSY
jgi:fibro-slime domain-containing protein